jgi:hypothetical protein
MFPPLEGGTIPAFVHEPQTGTKSIPHPSCGRAILDAPQIWPGESLSRKSVGLVTGVGGPNPGVESSTGSRKAILARSPGQIWVGAGIWHLQPGVGTAQAVRGARGALAAGP